MDVYAPLIDHFKEFYLYYLGPAAVLLPTLFFTRRYSVPLILYAVEIGIYFVMLHLVWHWLVGLVRWFAEESSMEALGPDGRPVDSPEWTTPLLQFWDKAAYDPQWIIYAEGVMALIIVYLVWRYRPLKVQKKRESKYFGAGKEYGAREPGGHAGRAGMPGVKSGATGRARPGGGRAKGRRR